MSRTSMTPQKVTRKERSSAKGRMRNFMMFLPNMVLLLGRLLKDSRVATAEKALFVASIVYVVSPIDLIPDFFPFIGQVDDIYVVALTLLRLLNRTDERVLREHWSGGGDIASLADSIARTAPLLLPKRVSRILTSRVEMGSADQILKGVKDRNQPIIVEVASPADNEPTIDTRSSMNN